MSSEFSTAMADGAIGDFTMGTSDGTIRVKQFMSLTVHVLVIDLVIVYNHQ